MTATRGNTTPHQPLRMPNPMWQAFGRVCARRGTNRNARMVELVSEDIRRWGDEQDKADLEAALAELSARRSRKGIRHRRAQPAAGPDQPVDDSER